MKKRNWKRATKERLDRVLTMREVERRTYGEIAKELVCTRQNAQLLYRKALSERGRNQGDPFFSLSVRASNVLNRENIRTLKDAETAIKSGLLHPQNYGPGFNSRNYGWKTHNEIRTLLGMGKEAPSWTRRYIPISQSTTTK